MSSSTALLNQQPVSSELEEHAQWVFDSAVAEVFDDMASRSIPGYYTTQQLSLSIAKRTAIPGHDIVDVGSATGTTLVALADSIRNLDVGLTGIEPSEPMRLKSIEKIHRNNFQTRIKILPSPAEEFVYTSSCLVLFNYTLHFVPPALRLQVLQRVFKGLGSGGAIVLGEKTRYEDYGNPAEIRNSYHRFKELNGYSKQEILAKERALKDILTPLSIQENLNILKKAGFTEIEIAFSAPPFVTILARKC